MNNFTFNIHNNYNLKELCGTNNRITFETSDGYTVKNHESFMNVDNICDKCNINKYYIRGNPNKRVIQMCIIPATIIHINQTYNGYVVVTDTDKLVWEIYSNNGYKELHHTLFDNPYDAGKDYYENMLSYIDNQLQNVDDIILWNTDRNNIISNERDKLTEYYNQKINDKLAVFIEENDKKAELYNNNIKAFKRFMENNKTMINNLKIDLTKYKEVLEYGSTANNCKQT